MFYWYKTSNFSHSVFDKALRTLFSLANHHSAICESDKQRICEIFTFLLKASRTDFINRAKINADSNSRCGIASPEIGAILVLEETRDETLSPDFN